MSMYLIQLGYTPQSWAAQIENRQHVVERITPALKKCGAKLESLYYAFGEDDVVGIIDFPTPEDAVAFALAVGSTGALSHYKTTPLLTIEQGVAGMKKAGDVRAAYTPP